MIPVGISNHTWSGIQSLFEFQVQNNPVFRAWVERTGRPKVIRDFRDLTFLPISFFRDFNVQAGDYIPECIFLSSGTTGQKRSQHRIQSLTAYLSCCETSFSYHFGDVRGNRHLFFLPFYQKNPNSSLLAMTDHFLRLTKDLQSRYVLTPAEVEAELKGDRSAKTVLWAVTYGIMDLLDSEIDLDHGNLLILETGGSKGMREVPPREELHELVQLRAPRAVISSEYGMCELSHQAYYKNGAFESCESLVPVVTDLQDPFSLVAVGQRGRICWIDLGNRGSCPFIETEDLGTWHGGYKVNIEGRINHADLRGCNLMYG